MSFLLKPAILNTVVFTNELSSKTGNIEYCGFHTIDLNMPVTLTDGDDFYIYVKLSNGGHPIDRTSEVPVLLGGSNSRVVVESDADPGESYYKSSSTWYDLYDYSFSDPSWDETANFCIKAMTGEYVPPLIPDLDVEEGELNWDDIKPGATVIGEFTVENIGELESLLDWEVIEWPEWGEWTFNPSFGNNLKPEDGEVSVIVNVIAPEEELTEYTGEIKIVNKEDYDDYEIITITLTTPRNKIVNRPFFNFLQNYPNMFPMLRKILGL